MVNEINRLEQKELLLRLLAEKRKERKEPVEYVLRCERHGREKR